MLRAALFALIRREGGRGKNIYVKGGMEGLKKKEAKRFVVFRLNPLFLLDVLFGRFDRKSWRKGKCRVAESRAADEALAAREKLRKTPRMNPEVSLFSRCTYTQRRIHDGEPIGEFEPTATTPPSPHTCFPRRLQISAHTHATRLRGCACLLRGKTRCRVNQTLKRCVLLRPFFLFFLPGPNFRSQEDRRRGGPLQGWQRPHQVQWCVHIEATAARGAADRIVLRQEPRGDSPQR